MAAMLTPSDVAAQWQCSAGHVRKLCRTGQLRAMRLGSDWRINPEAVAEFQAGNTNAAPAVVDATARQLGVSATTNLTALPTGDRVLGERWWETRRNNAASPAAGRGRASGQKKALLSSN